MISRWVVETVRLGVGDLDVDGDPRAFAGGLQAPLEAQVGDQAGDGHALLVSLGVEQLGHREVGVAVGVHRVLAVAVTSTVSIPAHQSGKRDGS